MPTIAFWNLGKRKDIPSLVTLIEENGIEILVVAEQDFEAAELIVAYAERTERSLHSPDVISSRIRFYSVFPAEQFRPVADDAYTSIKEYRPLTGDPLLIIGVHLPSKLFQRESDQHSQAKRLIQRIEEAEAQVGHERTLVVGDFNMNPFEAGMVDSDGLHGVMDRRVAGKLGRVVNGESRRFFYNPMWRLMGNSSSKALGTYYRVSGSYVHYFWNTFDQVLLRPTLLEAFREEELHIVQRIGSHSLLASSGPGINQEISDHLPITIRLNTEL